MKLVDVAVDIDVVVDPDNEFDERIDDKRCHGGKLRLSFVHVFDRDIANEPVSINTSCERHQEQRVNGNEYKRHDAPQCNRRNGVVVVSGRAARKY